MMVVPYKASRLQTLDEGVLLLESPVEFLLLVVPHAVEPNGSNRAVIGQELSQLTVHEGIIAVPIRGGRVVRTVLAGSRRVVRALPIHVAVVEMEFEVLLPASLCEFTNDVALERSGIHDVVRACLRCPHRKAIMMPAGKGDVLSACLLEELCPFASVEEGRVEASRKLGVLVSIKVTIVHHPLSVGQHGIDAPMKENAELAVLKLFADATCVVRDALRCS